jgi:hypothetical protein
VGRRVGRYLDGGRISEYQAIGFLTGLCGAVSVEPAPCRSLTGVMLGLFGIRQDAKMQAAIRDGPLLVGSVIRPRPVGFHDAIWPSQGREMAFSNPLKEAYRMNSQTSPPSPSPDEAAVRALYQ